MNRAFYTALFCAALALLPMAGRAAEEKAAKAKDAAPKVPNELKFAPSSFVDDKHDARIGKDVFFPKSHRFDDDKPKPIGVVSNDPGFLLKQLTLRGISGTGNRKLALLNKKTLAQGESFPLQVNGQTHTVKCEEIKSRSVVISIDGFTEKKELQLRDGL